MYLCSCVKRLRVRDGVEAGVALASLSTENKKTGQGLFSFLRVICKIMFHPFFEYTCFLMHIQRSHMLRGMPVRHVSSTAHSKSKPNLTKAIFPYEESTRVVRSVTTKYLAGSLFQRQYLVIRNTNVKYVNVLIDALNGKKKKKLLLVVKVYLL